MDILCFGDSNTYGYDPRGFSGGRYDEDHRWPDILAALTGNEVINEGLNGRTIPRREMELKLFEDMLGRLEPNMLLIMLGTNDLLTGAPAEEAAVRMERLLKRIPKGIDTVLIAPPAMKMGEWVMDEGILDERERLAELYRGIAQRADAAFFDGGELPLAYDGVHLSQEGNRRLAKGLYDFIKDML